MFKIEKRKQSYRVYFVRRFKATLRAKHAAITNADPGKGMMSMATTSAPLAGQNAEDRFASRQNARVIRASIEKAATRMDPVPNPRGGSADRRTSRHDLLIKTLGPVELIAFKLSLCGTGNLLP
jgi:hypothetical protein